MTSKYNDHNVNNSVKDTDTPENGQFVSAIFEHKAPDGRRITVTVGPDDWYAVTVRKNDLIKYQTHLSPTTTEEVLKREFERCINDEQVSS